MTLFHMLLKTKCHVSHTIRIICSIEDMDTYFQKILEMKLASRQTGRFLFRLNQSEVLKLEKETFILTMSLDLRHFG